MSEPGPEVAQPNPTAVLALLEVRQVAYGTLDAWLRLDRHEQERGRAQGRPRVKVVSREAMLCLAAGRIGCPARRERPLHTASAGRDEPWSALRHQSLQRARGKRLVATMIRIS